MSVDRNDIDDALNLLEDMRDLAESILDNIGELSSMRDELVTSYEDALEVGKYIEGIEREWGGYTGDIELAETPIDNCANDIINAIEDLMGSIHDGLAELEEEE